MPTPYSNGFVDISPFSGSTGSPCKLSFKAAFLNVRQSDLFFLI